jgi:hypothetical protein
LYFRYCHSEGEMLRRLADSLFIDNNSRAERATIEDLIIIKYAGKLGAGCSWPCAFICRFHRLAFVVRANRASVIHIFLVNAAALPGVCGGVHH